LRKTGLLRQVKHICSVSGGSILAAHLVLNWDAFAASTDENDSKYLQAINRFLDFVRKDVRGEVVRSWLIRWNWPKTRNAGRSLVRRFLATRGERSSAPVVKAPRK
jgi:hypothetical protein